ncbi:MAG: DUF4837 family protein, partial [Bacteroidota bacterium]
VTDSVTWAGPVGDALREELASNVTTLNPVGGEPAFSVRRQGLAPQFLNNIKLQRSVVFVAPLSDSTNTARFLQARFGEDTRAAIATADPGGGVIERPDLWARGQMIYFATDTTPERLADAIRAKGSEMRRNFNAVQLAGTTTEMYDKGRQILLEDTLMQDHDFAVGIQHDYFIATDTSFAPAPPFDVGTEAHVVWLRRTLVEIQRNLLVYYVDGVSADEAEALLEPSLIVRRFDRVTSQFLRGAQNDSAYVFTEPRISVDLDTTTIGGNEALEVRGLWRMNLFVQGGPFIAYAFHEPTQERLYLMYGFVLAPGKDKREFVRQLEAMARTFRIADAAAGPAEVAALGLRESAGRASIPVLCHPERRSAGSQSKSLAPAQAGDPRIGVVSQLECGDETETLRLAVLAQGDNLWASITDMNVGAAEVATHHPTQHFDAAHHEPG